ncbi:DMT family transporter [Undibacterium sp.]|uniref:DMT family transporter n=1 Tax=Undibacterium sp. TaxID=1914977 RepID=UPI002C07E640|nr:EamA family transporter [Undibacterium sp.]HTD04607.1 EamA family transporter [Undibacterium sp.]
MSSQPAVQTEPPFADYLLLLLLATLWGASYTFIKLGLATIPPLTLIAARTLIAGCLLLWWVRVSGIKMPTDVKLWKLFAFQALMNSVIPFTLIAWAEQFVDAGLATILNSTSPIFTFLITLGVTHHEPVTRRKLVGVLSGITGIVLVVGMGAMKHPGRGLLAQLAIVLATVCYAVAAIFGKNFKGLHPAVPAAGSLLSGAAVLLPVSLAVDHPWTLSPSATSIAALLGLGVVSTAFAFVLYFRLLASLGSIGTTSQAYLRVPIGVLLGALFLGEKLAPTAYFGLAFVMFGVAAMTIPAKPRIVAAST